MPSIETKQVFHARWKGADLDLIEITPNGTRIVARFDGDTEEGEATRTVNALNQHAALLARNAELVEALERILHPMASEDDIDHAQTVLTRAKS